MKLSAEQEEVVCTELSERETVVVIASAGSGKTRVVSEKINRDLQKPMGKSKKNSNAYCVLCMQFTNAAAEELKRRIAKDVESRVDVTTVHRVAALVLASVCNKESVLFPQADDVFEELGKKADSRVARAILSCFRGTHRLYVDEAQDLSMRQMAFIRRMADTLPAGLFFCGDPNQAIFGFQGGRKELLEAQAAQCRTYRLGTNWRSVPRIVEASNLIFGSATAAASPPAPCSETPYPPFSHVEYPNERAESKCVAGEIKNAVERGALRSHTMLVLARTRAVLQQLEKALLFLGVPCRIVEPEDASCTVLPIVGEPCETAVVRLSTIHSAKGTEADIVWGVAFSDRHFKEDYDERELVYVALTRARLVFRMSSAATGTYGQAQGLCHTGKVLLMKASGLKTMPPQNMETVPPRATTKAATGMRRPGVAGGRIPGVTATTMAHVPISFLCQILKVTCIDEAARLSGGGSCVATLVSCTSLGDSEQRLRYRVPSCTVSCEWGAGMRARFKEIVHNDAHDVIMSTQDVIDVAYMTLLLHGGRCSPERRLLAHANAQEFQWMIDRVRANVRALFENDERACLEGDMLCLTTEHGPRYFDVVCSPPGQGHTRPPKKSFKSREPSSYYDPVAAAVFEGIDTVALC